LGGDEHGDLWQLAECTWTITSGWYWHPGNCAKTSDRVVDGWYTSYGRGGQFLLNLPPNRVGIIPDNIVERAALFGEELKKSFEDDITLHNGVKATASAVRGRSWEYDASAALDPDFERYWSMDDHERTGWLEIDLGRDYTFDVISVSEHIALGQRVKSFSIEVYTKGVWRMWMRSTTIGQRRVLRWYPVSANKVRINISEALAVPCIEKVSIYKAFGHFALEGRPPVGLWIFSYGEFSTKGSWVEHEESYLGTGESGELHAKAKFFAKFWVTGNKDPNYGVMQVWVDGEHVADVDTSSSKHELEQVLYVSEVYDMTNKNIQLKYSGRPIAVHAIYMRHTCHSSGWPSCDTREAHGMFELDSTSYSVKRGEDLRVKVRRVAGSINHSRVWVTTVPDTAVPGVDYEHLSTDLEFENGEVEKDVTIKILSSGSVSRFSVEIMGATNGAIIGDNWTASVSIVPDGLGESSVEVTRFALGGVIVCGVCGILIVVLVFLKKRKTGDHLMKNEGLVNYTQSLDQDE
jgi:hypothetical protein